MTPTKHAEMLSSSFTDRAADYLPALLEGLKYTVGVALIVALMASVLGVVIAAATRSSSKTIRSVARTYVHVGRSIPELVQLFFIYYMLPQVGITFDPIVAGIIALSVATAPYMAEVFRAGLEGLHTGQWEAARVLGFEGVVKWRVCILPQVVRTVLPVWVSYLISIYKATALLSFIAVPELFGVAKALAAQNFRYFELFSIVMIGYLLIGYPTVLLLRLLERKLQRKTVPDSVASTSVVSLGGAA